MSGQSIREAYDSGRKCLEDAGVPEAGLDAWYLLEHVTGIGRAAFYADPGRTLAPPQDEAYRRAIERRSRRIPLQHITGTQEFMGLPFRVSKDVLIPRQDTETLVEEALNILKEKNMPREEGETRILDLCTGSGCILLSVMHYAQKESRGKTELFPVEGTGADISERALAVAEENAEALGIEAEFVQGDLFENIRGKFSMILSNPPYIRSSEIEKLQDEVRLYDPREALDGREDGLYFYRKITEESGAYMKPGGYLVFEIGYDQAEAVSAMMEAAGYDSIQVKKDLAGLDRVVCGVYSGIERPETGR